MEIPPREGELSYNCIETKIVFILYKYIRNIEKKRKQSKRGSSEMLMLVLSGVKTLKTFNIVN